MIVRPSRASAERLGADSGEIGAQSFRRRLLRALHIGKVEQMTRPATLSSCTWPELENSATTLLVAVGSLEQHGPHLPLDTDTRIASAVVARVHANLDDTSTLIAPPRGYGASGEHEGFPGTISLGHDALRSVLVEYGRSACRWAQRIVFVNGHGGNAQTLVDAIGLLRYEGRDVAWYPCAFDGADAHAGTTETSCCFTFRPLLCVVTASSSVIAHPSRRCYRRCVTGVWPRSAPTACWAIRRRHRPTTALRTSTGW